MYKVKVTFEFGDNDIKSTVVVEEFEQEEDFNLFLFEIEKLKTIDKFTFSFDTVLKELQNFDSAIYWFEIWPYHEHYGYAHITYVEKSVK
jgi:hypothetical protein